jgi:hypothetical protein
MELDRGKRDGGALVRELPEQPRGRRLWLLSEGLLSILIIRAVLN